MRTPVVIGVATGRAQQVLGALDQVELVQREGQLPRLVYGEVEVLVWRVAQGVALGPASATDTWDIYLLLPVDLGDTPGRVMFDRLKTLAAAPAAQGYLTRPWTVPALYRQYPDAASQLFPSGLPMVIAGDDPQELALVDYDPE